MGGIHMSNIRVFIDGIVYSLQWFGGLVTYWNNVILHLGISTERKLSLEMTVANNNYFPSSELGKYLTLVTEESRQEYDLFHSTYYTLPQNIELKQILTVHDTIYEDFSEYFIHEANFQKFMKRKKSCINLAAHIVAVSNTTKANLLQHYEISPAQITVIHHGISSVFHNARLLANEKIQKDINKFFIDKPFLLFVGGRRYYKNFVLLLKAFAISKINQNFILVVVGSERSFFDEEMEIIDKFKLPTQIKLLGFVKLEELISIYLSAYGFIFPTMAEGFGLPLLEAMACEIPVVCSDIPVLREVGGVSPIYFNPHDVNSLVQAIEELVFSSPKERILKGKQRSLEFQWQKSVQELINVYSKVLNL
ncbi:glycosyltransferase family 4 protein [Microseira wollei]|uniref:Glycosyltransferase n=1 Tax=Microseira wollei NIES-4236 TaxID=2530354 RepID=A0AAV3X0S1_9CYAN|nr:glycosyltransferase family 1 protein [Microseira wollei]GET35360.1 putative glycosyltransferase [Microseira wollei NIES-4236]